MQRATGLKRNEQEAPKKHLELTSSKARHPEERLESLSYGYG